MKRFALAAALLAAACSSNKAFDSLCVDQVPPPAACNTPCDPISGADQCPIGYHCSADGKCDTLCTPTGNECGASYTCTNDGFCQPGDNTSPPGPDADCPAIHFTATKVTPSIQILFDKSGSMAHDFNDNNTGIPANQKFTVEDDALVGTNGVVSQLQASAYFGVTMFPLSKDDCGNVVKTARALNNGGTIANLISNNPPSGSTPTPSAIHAAVADFIANKPPAGSPPVIVLSTDGLPMACPNDNTPDLMVAAVDEAKKAYAAGIKLFVLVVGNQFDDKFKRNLANAGQGVQPGQPDAKAYTATNAAGLTQAFQEIIGGVVSCDLKLNGHVDSGAAQSGSVTLNGMNLIFGTDWNVDADGTTLHLVDKACDTLKGSTDPKVDATFSCGAVLF
jgi:hypothetical protein